MGAKILVNDLHYGVEGTDFVELSASFTNYILTSDLTRSYWEYLSPTLFVRSSLSLVYVPAGPSSSVLYISE